MLNTTGVASLNCADFLAVCEQCLARLWQETDGTVKEEEEAIMIMKKLLGKQE